VVAEDHGRVGAVASVSQRSDPEHAVVDEVAEKYRVPFGRRIRLQRLEEPLEVTVHVTDDQNRQISHDDRS